MAGIGKLVLTGLCKIWIIVKMTQKTCHFYTIIFRKDDQYIPSLHWSGPRTPKKALLNGRSQRSRHVKRGFSVTNRQNSYINGCYDEETGVLQIARRKVISAHTR